MNQMMEMVMGFDGMKKGIKHIPGPEGVRGRNSDNKLILEKLGWEPTIKLEVGQEGGLAGWLGWSSSRGWLPGWADSVCGAEEVRRSPAQPSPPCCAACRRMACA